jgi:hypothetical protein
MYLCSTGVIQYFVNRLMTKKHEESLIGHIEALDQWEIQADKKYICLR